MRKLSLSFIIFFSSIQPFKITSMEEKSLTNKNSAYYSNLLVILNDLAVNANTALENQNLTQTNKEHIVLYQHSCSQFKEKICQKNIPIKKIIPALQALLESLYADCLIWEKYTKEQKISDEIARERLRCAGNLHFFIQQINSK